MVDPKKGAIAIWCSSEAMSEFQYEMNLEKEDGYYVPRNIKAEEDLKRQMRGSKVKLPCRMPSYENTYLCGAPVVSNRGV